jgi:Recombinase
VIEARSEIERMVAAGYGSTAIARSLNARRIPTSSGRGYWWPETVKRQLDPESWRDYVRRYRARQRRRLQP